MNLEDYENNDQFNDANFINRDMLYFNSENDNTIIKQFKNSQYYNEEEECDVKIIPIKPPFKPGEENIINCTEIDGKKYHMYNIQLIFKDKDGHHKDVFYLRGGNIYRANKFETLIKNKVHITEQLYYDAIKQLNQYDPNQDSNIEEDFVKYKHKIENNANFHRERTEAFNNLKDRFNF